MTATQTTLWVALLVACVGSYALKLAGVSLPESVLNQPTVQRIAAFLPVAMLAALVAVELFDGGGRYTADWRTLAGVAAAVVALLLRAGVLVVFVVAITVTALLRLVS
ncbi:MAG TPA: AzlD domain-containing protein [Microlunatus sp.]